MHAYKNDNKNKILVYLHRHFEDIKMLCIIFTLLFYTTIVYSKEYCQPGNSCWPNMEEIEVFKSSLSDVNECLNNFPTFTSKDEQGDMVLNEWYVHKGRFKKCLNLCLFKFSRAFCFAA